MQTVIANSVKPIIATSANRKMKSTRLEPKRLFCACSSINLSLCLYFVRCSKVIVKVVFQGCKVNRNYLKQLKGDCLGPKYALKYILV